MGNKNSNENASDPFCIPRHEQNDNQSVVLLNTQPPRDHLLHLSWSQRWDSVRRRCRTHPHEATHANVSRRTALHLAMFAFDSVPPDVVITLLAASRRSAVWRDSIGWTPLHYACQFGCKPDVVEILLCAAVTLNRDRVPSPNLHADYGGAKRGETNKDLEGGGSWKDRRVDSPLFLACNRDAEFRTLQVVLRYASLYPREIGRWVAPETGAERWDEQQRLLLYNEDPPKDDDDSDSDNESFSRHQNNSSNGSDGPGNKKGENQNRILVEEKQERNQRFGADQLPSPLTPLEALWSHFPADRTWRQVSGQDQSVRNIGGAKKTFHPIKSDAPLASINVSNTEDFSKFWDKILLLLLSGGLASRPPQPILFGEKAEDKIEALNRVDIRPSLFLKTCRGEKRKYLVLHHICTLRVPMPELARFVSMLYHEQLREADEEGNLPIHLALLSLKAVVLDCNGSRLHPLQNTFEASASSTYHRRRNVVLEVLRQYPRGAAVANRRGQFPLTLSLSGGLLEWKDGLDPLVSAAPRVLQSRDPATGLRPFMLAAVAENDREANGVSDTGRMSLDIVYRLLRASPELAADGIPRVND